MESRQDSLWLQGTRRYTRSVSNQEKEAKEKLLNSLNDGKNGEGPSDGNLKKKENMGTGHVVRGQNNEVIEYVTEDGISYKISDSAYVATERSDHPYSISTIQEIKPSKKDGAVVTLKWFYRPSEVPDSVYQMMVKDRLDATDNQAEKELILKTEVRNRELFATDDDEVIQVFPVSALRGKCNVKYLSNFQHVKGYDLTADSFFYVLGYNLLTRRLTSIQGEVKVGSSHQWTASTRGVLYKAIIPECMALPPPSTEQVNEDYEELIWKPRTPDCDLFVYLKSARSMAAFAGMCDGGSTEEGCAIAARDETTINAMNVLFQCGGDARLALQTLVKKPLPLTIERKWTEDQVKRFQKGLRQNGKNFHKIRKDQLPSKDTSDLVEFYYLWKKFQDSLMVLPQSKLKRQAALKRNTKTTTPTTENGEASSSENESVLTDESGKESTESNSCKHCNTTTSEDWDIGGKSSVMLCTKCRIKFKKYGSETHLDIDLDNQTPSDFGETERRTPLSSLFPDASDVQAPPCLFKPIKEKLKDSHKTSSEEDERSETPEIKKPKKRRWKAKKEEAREEVDVKEKRVKTEEPEDSLSTQSIKRSLSDAENETKLSTDRVDKEIKKESKVLPKSIPEPKSLKGSSSNNVQTPPILAPTLSSLHGSHSSGSDAYSKSCPENPIEREADKNKNRTPEQTITSYPPSFYPPTSVHPSLPIKSEQGMRTSVQIYQRFPIPPQSISGSHSLLTLPPGTENTVFPPRPPFLAHGGNPRVESERGLEVKGVVSVDRPTQSVYDPIHSRRKSADKSAIESDRSQRTPVATSSSNDVTNRVNVPEQKRHERSDSKSSSSIEKIPLIELEDDEDEMMVIPPILPEHHVTLPPGKGFPSNFRFYNDGVSDFRRAGQPIIVHNKKSRIASYPGFQCSRTDFEWAPISVPVVKKELKQPQQSKLSNQNKTNNIKPSDKDRDVQKIKPKTENINPLDHVTANPPRNYSAGHMRASSHGPAHGRMPTPSNLHTPISVDLSKHPPSHSSPYPVLGPGTPAIEQLRQYANIDSQREALSGLLPHSQPPFAYHMAGQSERDLRERELRERELRERMPKQGLPNVKLFDPLDPHAALALHGVHPAAAAAALPQSILNPQILDQLRQNYSVMRLASAMGIPGAPPVAPGAIPGFPTMLPGVPDILQQNPTDVAMARLQADRVAALEQYKMDLLHNHQHSHVHSHLHLHPQNHPPPGTSVFPPSVPQVNEAMVNPYAAAALALQSQAALAAAVDPVHAAASMNPMLNMAGVRPPAIMPTPAVPVIPPVIPGADPSLLLSQSQQLQAAAVHENLLDQHHRAAAAQQLAQQEYLMRFYAPKP